MPLRFLSVHHGKKCRYTKKSTLSAPLRERLIDLPLPHLLLTPIPQTFLTPPPNPTNRRPHLFTLPRYCMNFQNHHGGRYHLYPSQVSTPILFPQISQLRAGLDQQFVFQLPRYLPHSTNLLPHSNPHLPRPPYPPRPP